MSKEEKVLNKVAQNVKESEDSDQISLPEHNLNKYDSITSHKSNMTAKFGKEDPPKKLSQIRLALEQNYMINYRSDRRMCKRQDQKEILQEYFKEDPNWSYEKKMEIAVQIGMTPTQVSKWNWDERKKHNLPTERKRGKQQK